MFKTITRAVSCFLLAFSVALPAEEPPLMIYSATSKLPQVMQYIDSTVGAIARSVYPRKVEYKNVPINELIRVATSKEADIIIAGSSFTTRRGAFGYRDIGSAVTKGQKDIHHANGSTVITPKSRKDINQLKDLKGKTLIANDPEGFQGILILFYELKQHGFDPDNFFKDIKYVGNDFRPYLKDLEEGKADAMVMPSCHFEMMGAIGEKTDTFKVVGKKDQNDINCAVSTQLFPNWSIVVAPTLDFDTQHAILTGINSLSREKDGIAWGYAADAAPVDKMYRELKRGPYEYLRHWSITRIWEEYRTWIILLLALVAGFLIHYFRIRSLVAQRTKQLQRALDRQNQLTKRNMVLLRENQQMQNTAMVAHFSSIVAHELSQPLSGIILYANSLKSFFSKDKNLEQNAGLAKSIIDKLLKRALKSAEVVNEVRSFSKSSVREKEKIDLVTIIKKTTSEFTETEQLKPNTFILRILTKEAFIKGSSFDLKLILMNLLRNSLQATKDLAHPTILVTCSQKNSQWYELSVEDNGKSLDKSTIEMLGRPIQSLKDDGLGLGLSIVKYIVENHQGRIGFSQSEELGGLKVTISLRVFE